MINNRNNAQKQQKARVDPVEVYCRIRPLADNDNDKCLKVLDDTNLMLQIPDTSVAHRNGQAKQLIYSFTKIFDETTTQRELFDKVGYSLVNDLLLGKNGLLFTYGVTGSGKTHTMMGNQQNPGLLQRSLDCLFNSIASNQCRKNTFKPDKMNSFEFQLNGEILLERHKREVLAQIKNHQNMGRPKVSNADNQHKVVELLENHVYAVFISCIEIYNNYIYDLLDDVTDTTKRIEQNKESKSIKEDCRGMMYIKDVAEVEIKSTEEALEYVNHALRKRVVAYTDLNSESSRSHSIFTIRVVQIPIEDCNDSKTRSPTQIHVSQLSLVDLAGSERSKRTKNTGSRLKEAGNINSSLMALRNCMEVLRENVMSTSGASKKMVPYRDSKLTLLFKSFFEGTGKIKMILCINPSALEFDETINVLKFSELVKDVLVPQALEMRYTTKNTQNDEALNDYLNTLPLNYSLRQNFPPIDIFSSDDDVTIAKLIEFLEDYNSKRNSMITAVNSVNQNLYNKMRDLSDENERLREENIELRGQLETKEKNESKLEQKIRTLEKVINNGAAMRTPLVMNKENRPPSEVETVERKRSRDNQDTPQLPSATQTPIATFRSSRITESTHTTIGTRYGMNIPMLPPKTPSSVASASTKFTPASTHTTTTTQIHLNQYNRYRTPAKPPTATMVPPLGRDGVPVANKRQQRRSRSAETWLDHRPQTQAKVDTVLQPKMSRKKSVSRVELSDAKKSSKYVLTHQQQDDEGEVVTNLIKGDVFQSPSGGANIIFTDVETLSIRQQDVPRASNYKKRISDDLTVTDRDTVQERCSMSIEGHSTVRKGIK